MAKGALGPPPDSSSGPRPLSSSHPDEHGPNGARWPDRHWLAAAQCLAERARALSRPNPAVGAIVVRDGVVVGHGWTQPGGRPHAEAVALHQAGAAARGATLYVTLEPCAHRNGRGPACTDLLAEAGLARVVAGVADPDARTAGQGLDRLRRAGVAVACVQDPLCIEGLAGYLMQRTAGRPHVTLKLATSLDGCIALASGESQWITGPSARAHGHRERARHDAILVGAGTLRDDRPALNVRLPGLEHRSPERWVLTRAPATHGGAAPDTPPPGWRALGDPAAITTMTDVHTLLVEGGAGAAAAFLKADLVDRLLLYRAPILIGAGRPSLGDIGLVGLAEAHGRWQQVDHRRLGDDTLEILVRTR